MPTFAEIKASLNRAKDSPGNMARDIADADWGDILRAIKRSPADLVGAPVDLVNTLLRGAGGDKPVMGSQWIGDQLERAGLLPPAPSTPGGQATQFAAGMINPAGEAAKLAALAKVAGVAAIPKAARIVQGGEKAGKVRGTSGLFPESGGVTPQKETALVKKFVADAREGEPYSRYWYDNASKDLHRMSGEDVQTADKLAGLMATTSSGTGVAPNTMAGFKAYNQHLAGDPIAAGKFPTAMGNVMTDIMNDTGGTTGLKRTPYQQGLSVEWRPPEGDLRPVNDIHQASAMTGQQIRRGLSPAEHAWLDDMTTRALKQLRKDDPSWTSYQAQAAAWAPQRVKAGLAKDLPAASKHYGDFTPEYTAQITREFTPGKNTGHLP